MRLACLPLAWVTCLSLAATSRATFLNATHTNKVLRPLGSSVLDVHAEQQQPEPVVDGAESNANELDLTDVDEKRIEHSLEMSDSIFGEMERNQYESVDRDFQKLRENPTRDMSKVVCV